MPAGKKTPHQLTATKPGKPASANVGISGDKGERYVAKNTSIMCHQFTDSMDDKYHNIKAAMKETEHLNKRMIDILTEATGLVPSKVKAKLLPASDVYLTAEELLEFGVADHIL